MEELNYKMQREQRNRLGKETHQCDLSPKYVKYGD